jgi:hypothetical protein
MRHAGRRSRSNVANHVRFPAALIHINPVQFPTAKSPQYPSLCWDVGPVAYGSKIAEAMKLKCQFRLLAIDPADGDPDTRAVDLAFSCDAQVD